jgi:EF hand
MNTRLRERRIVFLLFLGTCCVALMTALPIVTAQVQKEEAPRKEAPSSSSAAAGASAEVPDFDYADRNRDGIVDKSEAGVVPGLSANFERADRNKDGKLDREEFAEGLRILQVRR